MRYPSPPSVRWWSSMSSFLYVCHSHKGSNSVSLHILLPALTYPCWYTKFYHVFLALNKTHMGSPWYCAHCWGNNILAICWSECDNRTFCPFLYLALFLCSRFIWYIISLNSPLNFNKTFFSFDISAWKYAPGTSKVATCFLFYASITSVVDKPSRDTLSDATLSPSFKCLFWLIQFAQVLPLMIPFIFYFMRFTASSACLLSTSISSSVFNGITTRFHIISPSFHCLNYFIIAAISISPNNLINLFLCIYINITFTAALMYAYVFLLFIISNSFIISCIFFFTYVPLFMINCICLIKIFYAFQSMIGFNRSTPFPEFYLLVPLKSLYYTS